MTRTSFVSGVKSVVQAVSLEAHARSCRQACTRSDYRCTYWGTREEYIPHCAVPRVVGEAYSTPVPPPHGLKDLKEEQGWAILHPFINSFTESVKSVGFIDSCRSDGAMLSFIHAELKRRVGKRASRTVLTPSTLMTVFYTFWPKQALKQGDPEGKIGRWKGEL